MPNNLQWMVVVDQSFYPNVELFNDFMAARLRFAEIGESKMQYSDKAKVYLGVLLRSHHVGDRLVTVEDW